jgi:hypothetical protein
MTAPAAAPGKAAAKALPSVSVAPLSVNLSFKRDSGDAQAVY